MRNKRGPAMDISMLYIFSNAYIAKRNEDEENKEDADTNEDEIEAE